MFEHTRLWTNVVDNLSVQSDWVCQLSVNTLLVFSGDSDYGSPEPSKFVSSPKLEKSCPFVRQPPDGCEKVKVIEDARSVHLLW